MCATTQSWLAFLPGLLTLIFTVLGGIALGAWSGALTRPLLAQLNLPASFGVGLMIGIGAALHTLILMVGSFFFNWGQVPVGLLAAGVLFGTLVALITLSWEGTGLAGGFLGGYFVLTGGAVFLFFNIVRWLSFLPPFLQQPLTLLYALLGSLVFAMAQIALLSLVAIAAALTARVVNQFLMTESAREA